MFKLSRANQLSMFPKSIGQLTKYIIPTLIGDIFETVTHVLFKSKGVSLGIGGATADLITGKTLIEVKSGYYNGGKAMFTDHQWSYYQQYYERYKNMDVDIVYMLYAYMRDGKRPFYMFDDEQEVIEYILKNICKLYIFDQKSLQILSCIKSLSRQFIWKRNVTNTKESGTHGFCIHYQQLEQFLSDYDITSQIIPASKLFGYTLCSFESNVPYLHNSNTNRALLLQNRVCKMDDTMQNDIDNSILLPEYEDKEDVEEENGVPF